MVGSSTRVVCRVRSGRRPTGLAYIVVALLAAHRFLRVRFMCEPAIIARPPHIVTILLHLVMVRALGWTRFDDITSCCKLEGGLWIGVGCMVGAAAALAQGTGPAQGVVALLAAVH